MMILNMLKCSTWKINVGQTFLFLFLHIQHPGPPDNGCTKFKTIGLGCVQPMEWPFVVYKWQTYERAARIVKFNMFMPKGLNYLFGQNVRQLICPTVVRIRAGNTRNWHMQAASCWHWFNKYWTRAASICFVLQITCSGPSSLTSVCL